MWSSWGSSGQGGEGGKARSVKRRLPIFFLLATGLVLLSMMLAACGSSSDQTAAQQSKARLDHELVHAHNDLGIPESLLRPIENQENKVSAGAGGFNYNYQDATSNYNLLYTQLIGIEQTAPQVLQQQTGQDIQALSQILSERRVHHGGVVLRAVVAEARGGRGAPVIDGRVAHHGDGTGRNSVPCGPFSTCTLSLSNRA